MDRGYIYINRDNYLNNIDYILQKHDVIINSMTIKNNNILISYIIVNDINIDNKQIIKYLREYIPEYEIPSFMIITSAADVKAR